MGLLGRIPPEAHKDEGHESDRKIDVETPTPRRPVGEAATNERPHDGSNTENQTEQALKCWSFVQRHHGNHDQHATREDAGRRHTSDGPADDEDDGAWSGTADSGADLKDHNTDQKNPGMSQMFQQGFCTKQGGGHGKGVDVTRDDTKKDPPLHVVELVDAAVDQLSTSRGQHVGGSIPADISQASEFIGYTGHGGGDDGTVEGNQEQGHKVANQSQPEPDALGLEQVVIRSRRPRR